MNSTDPQSFDIYLVNNAVYPSLEKKVASDVDTDKGSYTIKDLSGIANGYDLSLHHYFLSNRHIRHGFQINLQSDSSHNTGILAQSQQFNVSDGKQDSSTSTTATLSSSSSSSSSSSVSDISTTGSTTGYSSTGVSTDSFVATLITTTGSTPAVTNSATVTGSSSTSSASGSASGSAAPTFNAGESLTVKHHAAVIGFVGGAMAFLF